MPKVSVVVVSYNTRDKLRQCLSAIEVEHDAIVVDNASRDGSADMVASEFPGAKLIRNADNRGFGAANNQGIELASGELVLLLNSDCYASPGAIARLAEAFSDPSVVAAGGKLLNLDGSLQHSSANRLTLWAVFCEQSLLEKLFQNSSLFSPYWNSRRHDATAEVEQVMGACLMMRRDLERFDERFFLYCEDTELCCRLRGHGKILYVPEATFVHELGSSGATGRWRSVALYNRGKELYFAIHRGSLQSAVCWLLNRLGALLRMLVWGVPALLTMFLVPRYRRQAKLFWRVLKAPRMGPMPPARSGP
ncbi:MAG: glycosyltransferase family 2 protein [Armatimonadetes bacterium]|nr:glycosyltransferase family 2 protein [Armatimonadota bacterium]